MTDDPKPDGQCVIPGCTAETLNSVCDACAHWIERDDMEGARYAAFMREYAKAAVSGALSVKAGPQVLFVEDADFLCIAPLGPDPDKPLLP